jgi:hypothetical protein
MVSWEEGHAVPNSAQWRALKQRFRELNNLHALWESARYVADRSECEIEKEATMAVVPPRSSSRSAADAPGDPDEAAIRTIVEMARESIPNLRELRILIDDNGQVSAEFEVRKVVRSTLRFG